MAGVEPTPPPADLRRARAARPQTWLFLAAGAESLDPYANAAKGLLFGRHKVLFGYAGGQVGPTVSA
ncbi:MAG: hypothetical protein H0U62_03525, partial [Actinobacteria bacterium]|nr:hypothetical protein [Actinomycetota bacterium]